jgi:mRNA interferase RelE/StbE
LDNFQIAEAETFSKKINSNKFKHLYRKITDDIYPIIKSNPFYGINIKRLKGDYREIYRFRIGDYRLFYKIEEKMKIVFILNIENRKDAYK